MNLNDFPEPMTEEVINHAIDQLESGVGLDVDGAELHNALFNEDYFIIGHYQAQQFLGNILV